MTGETWGDGTSKAMSLAEPARPASIKVLFQIHWSGTDQRKVLMGIDGESAFLPCSGFHPATVKPFVVVDHKRPVFVGPCGLNLFYNPG